MMFTGIKGTRNNIKIGIIIMIISLGFVKEVIRFTQCLLEKFDFGDFFYEITIRLLVVLRIPLAMDMFCSS